MLALRRNSINECCSMLQRLTPLRCDLTDAQRADVVMKLLDAITIKERQPPKVINSMQSQGSRSKPPPAA